MKYKRTPHWADIEKQNGLLFFSQIVDESLFDYSLESYKPPALNTRLLCIEAIATLEHIKKGLIKKPNIKSIIDELLWSLTNDIAAKKLLGNQFDRFLEKLKSNPTERDLMTTVQLLYHNFDDKKYLKIVQELLIEKIPIGKEKENIYKLTRGYLTELINYGYSPGYVYHMSNHYFYNWSKEVTTESPEDFFSQFNFQEQSFTVIYKASKLFKEFESFAKTLKIDISDTYTSFPTEAEKDFVDSKSVDDVFIICNGIKAFDENGARIFSEMPLIKIANLFSFYHHKERPQISEFAIVIKDSDKSYHLLERPLKSIIKKEDTRPKHAALKANKLFESLNLPKDTLYRISRGVDLHSIALETNEIENKLLSLWTATETLIPKDIDSDQDRIVQIINALTPFQTYKYFENILNQAKSDFWYYDRPTSKDILNKVVLTTKDDLFYTIAAFITTTENDKARDYAYSKLSNYPLLKWRIFQLSKIFEDGKSALAILNDHKKKVEWQIRRIYRVRNLIVHSGVKPSYTNVLVENFHNYFDAFMNTIIDTAIAEKKIKTINQGILDIDFRIKSHIEILERNKDTKTSLTNFKQIISG